jgi:hypothetical protein
VRTQTIAGTRTHRGRKLGEALRGLWFYPVATLIAAGLIVASLGGGAFESPPTAQTAERAEGALVYGPRALAHGATADFAHVIHVRRGDGWTPDALRIAVLPDRGAPSPAESGVRILIADVDGQALAGRPVEVTLDTRSLTVTQGTELAVSLQNDGPITWVTQPLPRDGGVLTYVLPATEGRPPQALGLWAIAAKSDYNYGTEILSATLRPQ